MKDTAKAGGSTVARTRYTELKRMLEDRRRELQAEVQANGKLKGAINVSRGMLEFRADPESPYHNPAFQKDKTLLVYCASGGRSALVGKTLKDFGYASVYNIGGFKELADAGLEAEPA